MRRCKHRRIRYHFGLHAESTVGSHPFTVLSVMPWLELVVVTSGIGGAHQVGADVAAVAGALQRVLGVD